MSANTKKILVVDDLASFHRIVGKSLEGQDLEITYALNGKEGVEKAASIMPDLVLMDIVMPEMDGLQALELLKKDDKTKDIPVIMLTSIAKKETITEAFRLGAAAFILKSGIKGDELKLKVLYHLSKAKP